MSSRRWPVNMMVSHSNDQEQQKLMLLPVVIHTASGYHTASAKALILGLGERKKATGKEVHFIQVSCSFCPDI